MEQFEYDTTHSVDLKLDAGVNATAYKPQSISVTIRRPAPWISLGIATYTDDFVTTFFNVSNETYEVEIQENQNVPGFYRLVNPYGEAYPNNDPGDWDESKDYYMEIHAEDPDAVWIPVARMGFDWGYGEFVMGSIAGLYIGNGSMTVADAKAAGHTGTLKDGVITFPSGQLLIAMSDYNGGGLYTANSGGAFKVVLPGTVLADYSIETELSGYFNSVSGEYFAVVDVELGEDVEYALVASAPGTDADALYEAIIAGEADCVELTASGEAKVPAAEGKNVVVAVSFGGGEPQEDASLTFSFYAGADNRSPLEKEWTIDDIYEIEKDELFKRWIMWAVDFFDEEESTDRVPFAYVSFSESDDDYVDDYGYDVDAINVKGLAFGAVEDDTHLWEYYDGFIMNLYTHENLGAWTTFYINYAPFSSEGTIYGFYDEMMMGGLVDEGYMAMAYSGWYNLGSKPEPDGFILRGYTDAECETAGGNFEAYYNIMFEDPAVSSLSRSVNYSAKKGMPKAQFDAMAKDIMTIPANYVEKRGRERAHAIIDELKAKNASKTKNTEPVIELISTSKVSKDAKKEMKPVIAVSL